ncbi:hypothetical protein PQQ52_34365, partial [Paraburkholderia sediminicola]|uniref:hypothetical protein n=1 Tax=Paraburkholderia sediminicola TaxID=458836 RepID=UPI0038BA7DB6
MLFICLRRDGSKRRVIEGYLWFLPIRAGGVPGGVGFGFGFGFTFAALVCLCAYGVGLSLLSYWFISVAPVRGGHLLLFAG